ncbi:MAG: hypothetical protein HPY50_09060 [Firmicutes bacterium]|nr:hypothetical protein [Bacillota bacterium]
MPLLLILFLFAGIFTIAVLGIFLFSFIQLRKSKTAAYKAIAAVTGAYIIVLTAFFAWRIADITLSPKAIPYDDGTLVFEGHRYIVDSFDEFPYGKDIKKVALVEYPTDSKVINFINNAFFPSRLYLEGNDFEKQVLWERGLMLELKYRRVD